MATKWKQWTFEETNNLIEIYRQHENLWNQKNTNHKNRVKKIDSLKEIAATFETTVPEIERKLKNLNSQYQRERRNYKQMKKSKSGYVYESKWFGYAALSFLQHKTKKSNSIGLEIEDIDSSSDSTEVQDRITNINVKSEEYEIEEWNTISKFDVAEDPETESKNIEQEASETEDWRTNETNQEISATQINSKLKPKSSINKPTSNDESKKIPEEALPSPMMKTVFQRNEHREQRERDEFEIYGELLGHKIRNLRTEYARVTVQHFINNILFDAQIGKYDFPQQAQLPVNTCKCNASVRSE